jgi:cyclic pyranopterin phosphate synthase
MVDGFGRAIDYLRLSITDRCNLRCLYCMPAGLQQGAGWIPHDNILRYEQALRLCRILAGLGVASIKVTGGEPLVRRGAVDFIQKLKSIEGVNQVTMTSNGVLLGESLSSLANAGLDAINISANTLCSSKFKALTRSDYEVNVMQLVDLALGLGLAVKINCVPLHGFNENEIAAIAALAKGRNIAVRFIELMPLGPAASLRPLPADDAIKIIIEEEFGPLKPSSIKLGNGPAAYYTLPGFLGHIGIISAVGRNFCKSCNRLRLSASGILKPCLASDLGLDLMGLIKSGAGDGQIAKAIEGLVKGKPAGHHFGKPGENSGAINMYKIGG